MVWFGGSIMIWWYSMVVWYGMVDDGTVWWMNDGMVWGMDDGML
jgi:hypothetical protein